MISFRLKIGRLFARLRAALLVVASGLAAACVTAQPNVTPEDLQNHRWVLESINGNALGPEITDGKIPELNFGEEMRVSGNTGCNQYTGQAIVRNGTFVVEAMASTRMMCAPPQNDLELSLISVFGSESNISLDAKKMLTLKSGDTTLVFRPADQR